MVKKENFVTKSIQFSSKKYAGFRNCDENKKYYS
jgi:hypothetical protein